MRKSFFDFPSVKGGCSFPKLINLTVAIFHVRIVCEIKKKSQTQLCYSSRVESRLSDSIVIFRAFYWDHTGGNRTFFREITACVGSTSSFSTWRVVPGSWVKGACPGLVCAAEEFGAQHKGKWDGGKKGCKPGARTCLKTKSIKSDVQTQEPKSSILQGIQGPVWTIDPESPGGHRVGGKAPSTTWLQWLCAGKEINSRHLTWLKSHFHNRVS